MSTSLTPSQCTSQRKSLYFTCLGSYLGSKRTKISRRRSGGECFPERLTNESVSFNVGTERPQGRQGVSARLL